MFNYQLYATEPETKKGIAQKTAYKTASLALQVKNDSQMMVY